MKLNYKITETDYIPFEFQKGEVKHNIEVKFDYPTIEQDYKLKQLINVIFLKYPNIIPEKDKDGKEIKVIEYTPEQKADADTMFLRYREYYLKCVIKDIKGITDSEGNNIQVNIINDELEYRLWSAIMRYLGNNCIDLFMLAQKELEVNDLDKKK